MISNLLKETSRYNKNLVWFIIFILYVSVDTFLFGTSDLVLCSSIYNVSYIILAIYSFLYILKKARVYSNLMFTFIAIMFLMLMTMMSNMDISGGYFLYIMVYTISIFAVMRFSMKDFLNAYEAIFYYWTCVSLIAYFIFLMFPFIGDFLPAVPNSGGYDFKVLLFTNFSYNVSSAEDISILRNISIFREPGVYMLYILIAMIVVIFYRDKIDRKRFFIYLIAMITTFSTAGILLGGCLFAYVSLNTKDKKIRFFSFIFLIILLVLVFAGESIYYNQLFNKFDENSSSYDSTLSRIASITIPIEILFDNLYFGCGISNFPPKFSDYAVKFYGISLNTSGSSTNFILNTFAVYGFFTGFIFTLMVYGWCKRIQYKQKLIVTLFLFVILCAAFSNEDVRYSPFFHILLFYSLVGNNSYYSRNTKMNKL